jgi:serine/threonine protein phosphatase PrpC
VKRCPACQATYTDDDTFCEVDGEALEVDRSMMPTMPVAAPPTEIPVVGDAVGQRLYRAAPSVDIALLRPLTDRMLDLAAAFELRHLAWQPLPEDFVLVDGSTLALSHARGVFRHEEDFDARGPLRAFGEAVAQGQLVRAGSDLVELFFDTRLPPLSTAAARARLGAAHPEPRAIGAHAATHLHVGFRRERQEDSVSGLLGSREGGPFTALVLCDGVSSSTDGGFASRIGCAAAEEFFGLENRGVSTADCGAGAVLYAHEAVCREAPSLGAEAMPGSTIVVATIVGTAVHVAWAGDSRAYVVGPSRAEVLTRDHSWANEIIAAGGLEESEAYAQPMALALTRFIGPLDGTLPPLEPSEVGTTLSSGDVLVLCSDGLWSYMASAEAMAATVRRSGDGAVSIARSLVHEALVRGAHDNVSVAVYVAP